MKLLEEYSVDAVMYIIPIEIGRESSGIGKAVFFLTAYGHTFGISLRVRHASN